MRTDKWKGEDYPIRSLYVYAGNPVSNQVNTNEYINDVVGNMDLYVVVDYTFTDTVKYADIVLPASHWFEQQELVPISCHPMLPPQREGYRPPVRVQERLRDLEALGRGHGVSRSHRPY